MIYLIIFILCIIVYISTPIINNFKNPNKEPGDIFYTIMGVTLCLILIFGGLTFKHYGRDRQKERIARYYNLPNREDESVNQRAYDIIYRRLPHLEVEKINQRNNMMRPF